MSQSIHHQAPRGRLLAQPSQAHLDDHGEADEQVRALMAAADDQLGYLRAVVGLCTARLLMPIVASGDESMDGPDPDRHAEMAAVTVTNQAGEKALLAFTGIDSMNAWRSDARPVLGYLDDMAATVQQVGASHLLVDAAGPCQFVIGPDLVAELAQRHRLVELEEGSFGWMFVDPDSTQGGSAV